MDLSRPERLSASEAARAITQGALNAEQLVQACLARIREAEPAVQAWAYLDEQHALAQAIIFILGWPLEWTEIIIIFMPIFIPLLPHFGIDPLFFGLLVALNLQTAFLSPPVAMAAFYLKGVSPPHVTLNQIFAGMMPFMGIQVIALILLYTFPQIGLWLPSVFYGR